MIRWSSKNWTDPSHSIPPICSNPWKCNEVLTKSSALSAYGVFASRLDLRIRNPLKIKPVYSKDEGLRWSLIKSAWKSDLFTYVPFCPPRSFTIHRIFLQSLASPVLRRFDRQYINIDALYWTSSTKTLFWKASPYSIIATWWVSGDSSTHLVHHTPWRCSSCFVPMIPLPAIHCGSRSTFLTCRAFN